MQDYPIPEIPVVYYHSIGPVNQHWNRKGLTLEPRFFEDQLKYFKKNFTALFLKEYYQIRTGNGPAVKNPLVITIDDGFLDNWIWAFPLLKKYELKATIFICPEFVDLKNFHRPNLNDYWNNKAAFKDLYKWGYMNWEEMRHMHESGFIDFQSHTMSHTRYFVSGNLTDLHHPGNDCLYPVGNLYPECKPYHIGNKEFEKKIPYGTPFFEERSSVVARRITINPDFNKACVETLGDYDFTSYSFKEAKNRIGIIYKASLDSNNLILDTESDRAREKRIRYEIEDSKSVIEHALGTKVEFLCWPHGDNDAFAHQVALDAGYLSTTTGNNSSAGDGADRIPQRIGMHHVWHNRMLSQLKTRHKMGRAMNKFPYKQFDNLYRLITNTKAAI